MKLQLKKYELFWLLFLSLASLVVGWIYSLHQTDVHHWGFIAGTFLDHQQGRSFYSDMYVQYGVGQPLFFGFLNHFFTMNYTTIGIVTDFFYALNLILIYFCARALSGSLWAMVITAGALFIHSLPIYPWPDYYAATFMALSCLSLISKNQESTVKRGLIAGSFFFIAFIFRNTYLINFTAAFVSYGVLALLFQHLRNRKIFISIGSFFALVSGYFFFLHLQGNLNSWFLQTLETGQSQYGVFNAEPILKLLKNVFIPYKPHLPANLVWTTWVFLFYLAFFCIGISVFKKEHRVVKSAQSGPGVLLFFALLGLAGTSQTMVVWEVFRLQNASLPLYFVFAIFIHAYFPDLKEAWKSPKFKIAMSLYLVILSARFPHGSTYWPIYDGKMDEYQESKIPYFKYHRFRAEEETYYSELRKYLCDGQRKIINLTLDSTVPFLCEGQKNGLVLPFYVEKFEGRMHTKMPNEMKTGEFSLDELILADAPVVRSPKVKLVELVTLMRPASTRWYGPAEIKIYRPEAP